MHRKRIVPLLMLLAALLPVKALAADSGEQGAPPGKAMMRAAIFVQNRAGESFQDKVQLMSDLVAAKLTEKGFSILDRHDVVGKFKESRSASAESESLRKSVSMLESLGNGGSADSPLEDAINATSALRISQMIGADYLVMAALNSVGTDTVVLKGEGTNHGINANVTTVTLRVSFKVLEGNQGGTVYADTVAVAERIKGSAGSAVVSSELANRLVDSAAQRLAANLAGKTDQIRNARTGSQSAVEFIVESNVDGAIVELDGAAMGSAPGRFMVAPGLHQVRVTKGLMIPWERTVNIVNNQQKLKVALELSEAGMRQKEREAQLENERKLVEGAAKVLEGEGKKRENSYDKIEGPPSPIHEIHH